jgi:hypothetical protein|tara:strand:+ start:61 stop:195 length:135 start_codon:yes stop_codon:yes gene_type:complete
MGEKQGTREKIDKMIRHFVDHGTNPHYAKQKAREAAIKDEKRKR